MRVAGGNDLLNQSLSWIAERIPGARVGTVDKFQGQEAPVVIYSMATSSPEEAPHGLEFLFSRNRLNVATSRGTLPLHPRRQS
jgi:superfamily I DNA and/or RNA helicase